MPRERLGNGQNQNLFLPERRKTNFHKPRPAAFIGAGNDGNDHSARSGIIHLRVANLDFPAGGNREGPGSPSLAERGFPENDETGHPGHASIGSHRIPQVLQPDDAVRFRERAEVGGFLDHSLDGRFLRLLRMCFSGQGRRVR